MKRGRAKTPLSPGRKAVHESLVRAMEAASFDRYPVNEYGHSSDRVLLKRLVPQLAGDMSLRIGTLRRLATSTTKDEGTDTPYLAIGTPDQVCCYCGQYPRWSFNGHVFSCESSCAYAGDKPLILDWKVPNGSVAIGLDFREDFRAKVADIWGPPAERMFVAESLAEQSDMVSYLSAVGCAFGYIDGTRPRLYRNAAGDEYYVAELPVELVEPLGWKAVCNLPKNAQTFSMTDAIHHRLRRPGEKPDATYVDFRRGTWRAHHYGYTRAFKPLEDVSVYSRFVHKSDKL